MSILELEQERAPKSNREPNAQSRLGDTLDFMAKSVEENYKQMGNAFDEWTKFWNLAVTKGITPGNFSEFMRLATRKIDHDSKWATKNDIVLETGLMKLRHFENPNGVTEKYPVVILPPQAGHHSNLADYEPDQSLVRTFHSFGFDVFVTEWMSANSFNKNLGIAEYIKYTNRAVDKAKRMTKAEKVHMVGQCQGGWQSAIYTSLYPEKIAGLVVAAAPIDFEAKKGGLNFYADNLPMSFYKTMVEMGGGVMPGKYMLDGFKSMQPIERGFTDYLRMFNMALKEDKKAIKRHERFEDWYENAQNLPGKFYLEVVENIFKKNCLANPGSFTIDGRAVDLSNIKSPLAIIVGNKDHITIPEQTIAMKNLVSTEKDKVIEIRTNGGHIGTLMGREALNKNWPKACEFLKKA